MTTIVSYLKHQLKIHSIVASDEQLQQLLDYIALLRQWNRVYNLIANDNEKHIVDRHIIDSLLVLPYVASYSRIIDVGTGAGLPGIPLAIFMPDTQLTLLDSNGKKARFVTQAKALLHLDNVSIINERVEQYHSETLNDAVISRAFADLSKMLTLTQHLCKPEGIFIAMKGENAEKEMTELPPGFHLEMMERLPFADSSIHRQILLIKKNT